MQHQAVAEPDQGDFDPAQVPVFPVITVEVVEQRQLLVDGRTEQVPDDQSVTDAAVAAAAAAIRRRGFEHCRVAAVLDGITYPMVVGADGSRYDTAIATTRRQRNQGRGADGRGWVVPVAVMVLASITAMVAVVTFNQFQGRPQATPAPVAQPGPTELPVLPPDGWSTHAAWAVPSASSPKTRVLPLEGRVLAVAASGELTAFDAATGIAVWHTELPGGNAVAGPVRTLVDGVESVAVVTTRHLLWWPADELAPGVVSRVELPERAEVTFSGASPLVTLPDQHAAVIDAGQLSDRVIPAGATGIRADGRTVTALDGRGRLWRISGPAPRVPDPTVTLRAPRRGQEPTLLGVAGDYLVIGWRSRSGVDADLAVTTSVGQAVASRRVPGLGDRTWHADHHTATVAGHLIEFRSLRITAITDSAWRTATVVNGVPYGTSRGVSATLNSDGEPEAAVEPDAVPPAGVDAHHAYVLAEAGDRRVLYALERA